MNLVVAGTRPEVIKLYPFTKHDNYRFLWINQSKDLKPDLIDFDYEVEEFSEQIEKILNEDWEHIIVQGDTRTAMYTALKAFELGKKVVHVEAGLRTYDLAEPFPEEGYRQMIDCIATKHYCPTFEATENLLDSQHMRIVGQTSIDTLLEFAPIPTKGETVLVTIHRREAKREGIIKGLNAIAKLYKGLTFLFIEHPNQTSQTIKKGLKGKNWKFLPPQDYKDFLVLLAECYAVITDSGGLQEEAPSLNKPILVARDVTERQEGVEVGCAILGGMTKTSLLKGFTELIGNYKTIAETDNPYGDGRAVERIVDDLRADS